MEQLTIAPQQHHAGPPDDTTMPPSLPCSSSSRIPSLASGDMSPLHHQGSSGYLVGGTYRAPWYSMPHSGATQSNPGRNGSKTQSPVQTDGQGGPTIDQSLFAPSEHAEYLENQKERGTSSTVPLNVSQNGGGATSYRSSSEYSYGAHLNQDC